MSNAIIKTMYCVYGDYGNYGGGRLLGVFTTKELADEAAVGCGSLDCGGDGEVQQRQVCETSDGDLFVLENTTPLRENVMSRSQAKVTHYANQFRAETNQFMHRIEGQSFVQAITGLSEKYNITKIQAVYIFKMINAGRYAEVEDYLRGIENMKRRERQSDD